MKILLLAQVFPPRQGGSGRWMWELYRRLRGADVTVAASACGGDWAFDAKAGLRVERIPLDFSSWGLLSVRSTAEYVRAFARVRSIVSLHAPAQIHCAKVLPEGLRGFGLLRLKRIPYTCFTHGEELTLAGTSRELRCLARVVLHSATRVIANSEFTKRLLLEDWALAPDRVSAMSPGVDTQRFVPAAWDPLRRSSLGWSGRRVIFTVGTMQKRKGQDW